MLRLEKIMRIAGIIALCAAALMASAPATAHAQDPAGEQIDSSPKGLIGLGLIGAELGLFIPAAAGLDDTWALVTFPIVGAAGGAVAGHFAIDNRDKPKVGVAMLVTGLALVVPTIVGTLAFTAYDPEDDMPDEEALEGEAVDEEEGGTVTEPEAEVETETASASPIGGGLLRLSGADVSLGVPDLAIMPTYTNEELQRFGGDQVTEYRLALVSGSF